jgi:hypothetical protein
MWMGIVDLETVALGTIDCRRAAPIYGRYALIFLPIALQKRNKR